jgi:hypothetical protein
MTDFTPALVTPSPCPPTMRIAEPEHPAGFIIVNVEDFDPATMTEFEAPKASRRGKADDAPTA